MCAGTRIMASGTHLRDQQCPSTETTHEDYQKNLLRLGQANPDLTIGELAQRIQRSPWWILEKLLFTPRADPGYPRRGERFVTDNEQLLVVARADKFAVHWEGGCFSLHEDVRRMRRV